MQFDFPKDLYINKQLQKKICKYIRQGKPCPYKEGCIFSHEIDTQLCKYISIDKCKSRHCLYRHKQINNNIISP